MKGRQQGRPVMWVYASANEKHETGKAGFTFEVWEKWRKTPQTKYGTLTVSVGGVRWSPAGGKARRRTWKKLATWMMDAD